MRERIWTELTNTTTTTLTLLCCLTFTVATACECTEKKSVAEELKSSDAVIVATALSRQEVTFTDSTLKITIDARVRYDFLIEHIYKGTSTNDTITFFTGFDSGDCGKHFVIGVKYVIYGNNAAFLQRDINKGAKYIVYRDKTELLPTENTYSTTICKRTTIYKKTEIDEIEKHLK